MCIRDKYVLEKGVEDCVVEDEVDVKMICPGEIEEVVYCEHGMSGRMAVKVQVDGKVYCGLIDTGSQISLVNASVVRELEQMTWQIPRRNTSVKIKGICLLYTSPSPRDS